MYLKYIKLFITLLCIIPKTQGERCCYIVTGVGVTGTEICEELKDCRAPTSAPGPQPSWGGPGRRRLNEGERRLHESDVSELNDCNKALYQISVKTTGSSEAHISFLAKPQYNELEEESSECPVLSFDSALDNGKLDSAIHIVTEASDAKESLFLGLFQLSVILDAFTSASIQNSGTKYDFFANNCASFLISMGLELGINPGDKKITSFIAQQISSEFVMDNLLATGAGKIHTELFGADNEDAVVEEFVSDYIHQRI